MLNFPKCVSVRNSHARSGSRPRARAFPGGIPLAFLCRQCDAVVSGSVRVCCTHVAWIGVSLHSALCAPSAHLWEFLVSHFVSQPRQRHPISIGRCRCRTDLEHLANLSPALAWPKGELRGQDLGNLLGRLCTGQVCAVSCLVLIGLRARIRWAERGLK